MDLREQGFEKLLATEIRLELGELRDGSIRHAVASIQHELDLAASGARPPSFGYPLAWCFTEEHGRVFSTSLGHFPAAWESPDYLRHLAGGLGWALAE